MPNFMRFHGERAKIARFVIFVVSCAASLALLEGLATAFAWWKYGTIDVGELTSREKGNTYFEDQRTGYLASLYPHPYLGFVHNKKIEGTDPQNAVQRLNNVGLVGRDFPLRRDPSKFTILVTGGSVASQLCRAGEGGKSYLERALQERYQIDREVVVLSGAAGAWKQPQQAIVCLLYGDVVDAVVTLDGFNEHLGMPGKPLRVECPFNNFHQVNPLATDSFEALGAAWQIQKLRQFTLDHDWRTVYFATRIVRDKLQPTPRESRSGISIESIFALPRDWSSDQCMDFNLEQYQKYVRSIDALAAARGLKRAYFIQPCPAIGKKLTPEELKLVGALDYADAYRKIESRLVALRGEGISVVSLLDVFAETAETVYEDRIHCRFGEMTDYSHAVRFQPSLGYRIMSDAIADHIARMWQIPRVEKPAEGR